MASTAAGPSPHSPASSTSGSSATSDASSSHSHGATTSTSPPAATAEAARRAATGPPPTTRTRRPVRSRTTGYDGVLTTTTRSARACAAGDARWVRRRAARCRRRPDGGRAPSGYRSHPHGRYSHGRAHVVQETASRAAGTPATGRGRRLVHSGAAGTPPRPCPSHPRWPRTAEVLAPQNRDFTDRKSVV